MRRVVKNLAVLAGVGAIMLALGVAKTEASELNLTGSGALCTSTGGGAACPVAGVTTIDGATLYSFAGALWSTTQIQPTGSGYIDSFLRIQDAGGNLESLVVDGMNTDVALLNDEKEGPSGGKNFTHTIKTSDLQEVDILGTKYYQFLLDINQEGGDPLLTLSGLQLCQSQYDNLSYVDSCAGADGKSTIRYDLASPTGLPGGAPAAGANGYDNSETFNQILLDYKLNSGSGSGDMYVYIPTSLLPDPPPNDNQQLYLWSQFGAPTLEGNSNNDGYEEWAFLNKGNGTDECCNPPSEVPEPGSLVLLGTGLLFGGHLIRRRSRKQQAAKAE